MNLKEKAALEVELSMIVSTRENTAKLEGPTKARMDTIAVEINGIRDKLKDRLLIRER